MRSNYHITSNKGETEMTNLPAGMAGLTGIHNSAALHDKNHGRNLLARTLDAAFGFVSRHLRPLHVLGFTLTAVVLYVYARVVAWTARLVTSGEGPWPNVPAPGVVALWHGDAPSLLVAFAMRRPKAPTVILVASDPRGDYLALLCRMLGFEVVRTGNKDGNGNPLAELAGRVKQGACVIITADGGGPAKIAKVGAVALASATGVPLVPLRADCHPALQQSHKWDAARNPLPFSSISVSIGTPQQFAPDNDEVSIERARSRLEQTLNEASPWSTAL